MSEDFVSAIIPAAGMSSRMNAEKNKNFLCIQGYPVLSYSLTVFCQCKEIQEIILVHKPGDRKEIDNAVNIAKPDKPIKLVFGGETRQQSVYFGLGAVDPKSVYTVIHDAARPFVTREIIENCLRAAKQHEAACAAVKAKDTYVLANRGEIESSLNRDLLYLIQTPQIFRSELILRAHEAARADNVEATDDTTLVKRIGHPVALTPGSYDNIKLTTYDDLLFAEMIMRNKKKTEDSNVYRQSDDRTDLL
ncbi:MAG: 2-C-methyl-D-erythritol 4-phosphate cytidylyltransferase [Anaerofustis sp.]